MKERNGRDEQDSYVDCSSETWCELNILHCLTKIRLAAHDVFLETLGNYSL